MAKSSSSGASSLTEVFEAFETTVGDVRIDWPTLTVPEEWDDEDEDSRDDRDVIMYTLSRYIDIKPNEQDLLYSYLTLRRLATEATDPNLLLALIGFPNFEFLVRGKEKITLRETIARNRYIDQEIIQKLLSFVRLRKMLRLFPC